MESLVSPKRAAPQLKPILTYAQGFSSNYSFSPPSLRGGLNTYALAAFRRFCRSLSLGVNPLLSRVCGFTPNAKSRRKSPETGLSANFATPSSTQPLLQEL